MDGLAGYADDSDEESSIHEMEAEQRKILFSINLVWVVLFITVYKETFFCKS